MKRTTRQDPIVLCSQENTAKIGNLFDTVLVLSQRMRELRSGHAAMTNLGDSTLSKAMHEIDAGKVDRQWLRRSWPTPSQRKGPK